MSAAKNPFISYAQNQEDVLLWRVFKDQVDGFYIDVGAAHPEWESVTKAFYDRGWRGINFEPNPHFYSMLVKERIRDINICALVGGEEGERELHIVGNSGLSTASQQGLDIVREHNHVVTSSIVCKMVRLDDIIREHGAKKIHFLKIDAEGMEKEVLKGCSLSEFRPKILVIEATIPETNILRNDGIREHLASQGYIFMLFDGLNDYFVATECQNLAKEFNRPVNILDNFYHAHPKRISTQSEDIHSTKVVKSDRGWIGVSRKIFNSLERLGSEKNYSRLRAEDVVWAYQQFFERSPENQEIINLHIKQTKNIKLLVEQITQSREYEYKKYKNLTHHKDQSVVHYFFHIHKTGGTSVHEYLREATPSGELLPGFHEEDILNIGMPQTFSFLSGHFGRLPLLFKGRRLRLATVLRDPIQRGLSHYKHAQREKKGIFSEKIHREISNIPLEEFLYSPTASIVFGNHQASHLAELSLNATLLAQKSIENMISSEEIYDLALESLSKMELVGTTQKLDEFISSLADRWDLPQPTKKYIENIDPNSGSAQLTQSENARIRELCAVDLKIYDYVNQSLLHNN